MYIVYYRPASSFFFWRGHFARKPRENRRASEVIRVLQKIPDITSFTMVETSRRLDFAWLEVGGGRAIFRDAQKF
jgi:hypothetical protein